MTEGRAQFPSDSDDPFYATREARRTGWDDNHELRPASDKCVREAVRAAMAEYPELDGHELRKYWCGKDKAEYWEVWYPDGSDFTGDSIRRDTLDHLTTDASALALKAAEGVRYDRANACTECARLGPPNAAPSYCSECGARSTEEIEARAKDQPRIPGRYMFGLGDRNEWGEPKTVMRPCIAEIPGALGYIKAQVLTVPGVEDVAIRDHDAHVITVLVKGGNLDNVRSVVRNSCPAGCGFVLGRMLDGPKR